MSLIYRVSGVSVSQNLICKLQYHMCRRCKAPEPTTSKFCYSFHFNSVVLILSDDSAVTDYTVASNYFKMVLLRIKGHEQHSLQRKCCKSLTFLQSKSGSLPKAVSWLLLLCHLRFGRLWKSLYCIFRQPK